MTFEQVITIVSAVMPLLLAIVAGFVAIYSKVDGVHKQINSRMDELVASTRALAHAQGMADERERRETAVGLHTAAVAEGVQQQITSTKPPEQQR